MWEGLQVYAVVLHSVTLGVLAALGWGLSDLAAAAVSRRLGVLRTTVGVHVVSIAATTPYLLVAGDFGRLSSGHWGLLAGLSVLAFATYLAFYRALQQGPVAVVSPIMSANAVVIILLAAIIVGDRLSGAQYASATAIVGGVVLMSMDPRRLSSRRRLPSAGVLFALAAMVGIGLWQYSIGVLSKELGWFLPVYVSRLLVMAILAPVSAAQGRWPWQGLTAMLGIGVVLVGFLETGALFAFTRGTEVGVISIVAAAYTVYPIVPVVGGLLVFRERIAPTQVAGLAIALVGLFVLALNA